VAAPSEVAVADLAPLFAPRRVAVLGASRSPAKLGHVLLRNLLAGGFGGEVVVVHPGGEPILGRPAVARARDLPEGVDLALVSLPAAAVPEAVAALGRRRCRACVILASGFGETGPGGREEEARLRAVARESGMRIVGPNCMGVVNVPGRLNGSYFWSVPERPGGITFVSQSGAYGGLFFREARARGLGVAKLLSVGNQADLGVAEVLAWLAGDPDTRVVALFLEGLREGRAFVEAARRLTAVKPAVVLKGGRAEAGRRAAGSHTGALAGAWETYRAAFAAGGLVVVEDTEELFDAVAALDAHADRLPAGRAVAIVTVSGGPSVVAADTAEAVGLEVPPFPAALRAALRRHLPAFGADANPVDLTPQVDPAAVEPAVRLAAGAPGIGGTVAIAIGLDRPEYGRAVAAVQAATGRPAVACTLDTPALDRELAAGGVPAFPTPERAVRAYRALVARAGLPGRAAGAPRRDAAARPVPLAAREALAAGGALAPAAARLLLLAYGVPFPPEAGAATVEEAVSAAERIGYPVVLKTGRADVLHKTEAGGVVLGVGDAAGVRAAARAIATRVGPGPLLVQAQAPAGVELLVGGRRDPTFGPVVVAGLGGVLTELWREAALRLAPVTEGEARAMLEEGRTGRLLAGYRGAPPADLDGLAAVVAGMGDLLAAHPEVTEVEVNPLIVAGRRALAVDALVLATGPGRGEETR
jgi:acyl-CoA synthetase (NDP forming)